MRFSAVPAMFALLVTVSVASAQTTRAPAGSAPAPRTAETPPAKPKPMNNEDARLAGQAMGRNGGSLLKATLTAPVDPGQAKLGDVSYFSVPEPEPRLIKKHDLVTVIIREESEFSSEGTTEATREAEIDARIEEFIKLDLEELQLKGGGISAVPPSIVASSEREFKGEGTVDRTDSFTARITAEVIDVKPNGTLVLQGRKKIKTDEEFQQFLVTGSCRAEDVTADNTVLSTQLKDFDLRKTHKGAVRDATKRGLVTKLLDAIGLF